MEKDDLRIAPNDHTRSEMCKVAKVCKDALVDHVSNHKNGMFAMDIEQNLNSVLVTMLTGEVYEVSVSFVRKNDG